MKKKLFIVLLMLILCTIIVNLSYDFFMDDRLVTIREKLTYRKIYAEREILENINGEKELSHNDIKITLENNSYDKEKQKTVVVLYSSFASKIQLGHSGWLGESG